MSMSKVRKLILIMAFLSILCFIGCTFSSLDYDDDRYYIANNLRNSHYALHPNPSPVQNPYVQKPIVVTNYPSNRLLSQMKRTSLNSSPTDPKQDVGLPRSSIVWMRHICICTLFKFSFIRFEMNCYQRATSPMTSHTYKQKSHRFSMNKGEEQTNFRLIFICFFLNVLLNIYRILF